MGYFFNPFRSIVISKMVALKSVLSIVACFLFMVTDAFSQKIKPVELIVECVEYIGDGMYKANFGYTTQIKTL